jgi:hypothetical protein
MRTLFLDDPDVNYPVVYTCIQVSFVDASKPVVYLRTIRSCRCWLACRLPAYNSFLSMLVSLSSTCVQFTLSHTCVHSRYLECVIEEVLYSVRTCRPSAYVRQNFEQYGEKLVPGQEELY